MSEPLYRWQYDDGNITDSGEVTADDFEVGGVIMPLLRERYGDSVSEEHVSIESVE